MAGPPTSTARGRQAGPRRSCSSAAAAGRPPAGARSPTGAAAEVSRRADGRVRVRVSAGDPLDEVVLRSYGIGAAHMALGWVTSRGSLTVDPADRCTTSPSARSVCCGRSTRPAIEVEIDRSAGEVARPPVNGSDAVFAAVAAAVWRHQGFPPDWPTRVPFRR